MLLSQMALADRDLVQETLLGEAIEHAPVGVIVLDEEGRYLAANRLACTLSGYTREELLGGGARALAFEPDRVPATMARMLTGDLKSGTAPLKRKDGEAVTCEYRVGATRSGGLPYFILVFWQPAESE